MVHAKVHVRVVQVASLDVRDALVAQQVAQENALVHVVHPAPAVRRLVQGAPIHAQVLVQTIVRVVA